MRRLVHIFLFVTLLGFALSGCRQSAAERQLVEIDTLIARGNYDSALAQLRAIDTTTLSRDELAYHGLLMAHAAYKAYDSVYLDTTWIARARTAYADGGPYDRHIRSLLYSGCVAEDLGDPLTAMRWLKLTELDARPDDHFHKGYALMIMGIFYFTNLEDSFAIARNREALSYFDDSQSQYTLFCSQQLAQSYLKNKNTYDSAAFFAEQAKRIAIERGDSLALSVASMTLAERWLLDHDYKQAKTLSVEAIRTLGAWPSCECWQVAALSYTEIGLLDSAQYYFSHAPAPTNPADTIYVFKSQSAIAKLKGDVKDAQRYEILCDSFADQTRFRQTHPTFSVEEDGARRYHDKMEEKSRYILIAECAAAVLVAFLVLMLLHRRRARQNEAKNLQIAKQLNSELDRSREQTAELNRQFLQARKQIREISETMQRQLASRESAIEELRKKNADELQDSLELIKLHVEKVNRMISASSKGKEQEMVETFSREAQLSEDELNFWMSGLSTWLLNPQSREVYETILTRCEFSYKEKVLLKLIALDFSDREIQMLLGAASEDYVRVTLSRIKKRAGWEDSIRKTFRKLNK